MTPTIVVLILVAVGIGIVVWAIRKKPDGNHTGPQEGDTGWNDPVTPGEPARPDTHSPQEPRP